MVVDLVDWKEVAMVGVMVDWLAASKELTAEKMAGLLADSKVSVGAALLAVKWVHSWVGH